jgi:adenosine deaminase
MRFEEYLRRMPKVELHCHLLGTMRPETVADLALKHGVALPTEDVASLYRYDSIEGFIAVAILAASTVRDADDLSRIAYESIADGARLGNLRHREMSFNPTLPPFTAMSYTAAVDGIVDGLRAAEADFGVSSRLIAAINRGDTPEVALEMVEQVLASPRDEVIGLGLDGAEAPDPPEKFAAAYRLAARGGLHRTAHACEDAPARNVATCLDLLGCERIDHGYYVLGDEALVERCREQGVCFTACPTASAVCYFDADDFTAHPIREMVDRDLTVMLNSDDPPMFHTDIGEEYVRMARAAGWGLETVRELCLNGVEAAWLPADDRRRLREDFEAELTGLEGELVGAQRC